VQLHSSKLEEIISVLDAVKNGNEKPGRIMYRANLSWSTTKKVLESLVRHELFTEIEDSGIGWPNKRYVLTEKGQGVLDYIEGSGDLSGP